MNPSDPSTSYPPFDGPEVPAPAEAPPTELLPPVPPPVAPMAPPAPMPPVAPMPPPGGRTRPFFFTKAGLVTFVVVVVLLAAAFVSGRVTAPSTTPKAAPAATVTAVVTETPAPVTVAPSPTDTPTASAPAAGPSSSPSSTAPAATGGTDLSALTPVNMVGAPGGYAPSGYKTGPEPIGTTTYPNSIRFTCQYKSYIVYNVAGATSLRTILGIPSDATNALNGTMSVTFFKDSVTPTSQLGPAYIFSLDRPRTATVSLVGVSQLVLACSATDSAHNSVQMDMALADPVLGSS